ncbi:hypothetical protein ABIC89_001017 [Variovorax boronicumulans]|uniref:hypothetical protein n=1 Tax=Variovorax boronicumulans TaxID=436515 RepID=UPI00339916D6
MPELDIRMAALQSQTMARYVDGFTREMIQGLGEKNAREFLGKALDHLQETAAMLGNVSDRLAALPPVAGEAVAGAIDARGQEATDPYQAHMAAQAGLIDIDQLSRALVALGISQPEGREELAARVGSFVNCLTRYAQHREQSPASPNAEAGAVAGQPVIGWLYDWVQSSALGKPDELFTSFTVDEAYAKKDMHSNARAVALIDSPVSAAPASAPEAHHRIPGLGFISDEDEGRVTLQFKDEAAASQFMKEYGPSVDIDDMPTRAPEAPKQQGEALELRGVADTLENDDGCWRSCSGCHELNEGHDTGPYSAVLKCHLGSGCSECGGIGAIWDTTDYADMADHSLAQAAPATGKVGAVPCDGDYLRWAEKQGAKVDWAGRGEGVRFTAVAWGRFCDVLRATPAPTVQAETGEALRIAFNLYETSLPEAPTHSTHYGGQWSSEWCIVITPSGSAQCEKFTVSESEKEMLDRGERPYSNWHKPGWPPKYLAWAYGKDVVASLKAAQPDQGGAA